MIKQNLQYCSKRLTSHTYAHRVPIRAASKQQHANFDIIDPCKIVTVMPNLGVSTSDKGTLDNRIYCAIWCVQNYLVWAGCYVRSIALCSSGSVQICR